MTDQIPREKVVDNLYLFLRTIYHYERGIERQFGLNYREIYLLQCLRRKSPQRLTEAAATLDIPMFAASRLVGRLVKMKLVEKVKNNADRRSISLSLLPAGEVLVQAVETDSVQRVMQGTSTMPADEVADLMRLVEKLHEILGIPAKFLN